MRSQGHRGAGLPAPRACPVRTPTGGRSTTCVRSGRGASSTPAAGAALGFVGYGSVADRDSVLGTWLAAHADGVACVIGDPSFRATPRVRSLTPGLSKGLEFDLVVLVDPEAFGEGIEGAVDRYVAMTRATQQLAILTGR